MSRCPKKTSGHIHRRKRAEKQKKECTRLWESRKHLDELEHQLMQPTIEEIKDKHDTDHRIRSYIIDAYKWDPSAERSPTDKEMDDLCDELLGKKEWDEGDNDDNAKLNEQLKAQGLNSRTRQMYIRATRNKSVEILAEANAKKQKKSFEEMVPGWLHDY
jgi:hypothetical protein